MSINTNGGWTILDEARSMAQGLYLIERRLLSGHMDKKQAALRTQRIMDKAAALHVSAFVRVRVRNAERQGVSPEDLPFRQIRRDGHAQLHDGAEL